VVLTRYRGRDCPGLPETTSAALAAQVLGTKTKTAGSRNVRRWWSRSRTGPRAVRPGPPAPRYHFPMADQPPRRVAEAAKKTVSVRVRLTRFEADMV